MNFDLVKAVPELDVLNRSTLDAMTPKEFDDLHKEVKLKYPYKWMNAFNHLMLREYESDFVKWIIDEDQVNKVKEAIPGILNKKTKESHYKSDGAKKNKRWRTGKESEFVVENYTGFRFVDLEAYGDSNEASGPDLIGRVGVKSSSFNNFPVIKRDGKHKIPEIIVVKYDENNFRIAGLFTPEMLNKYTTDELVKMRQMCNRKTAFYHYGVGIKFGPGRENLSMLLYDLGY